jgi:hypothetical protein
MTILSGSPVQWTLKEFAIAEANMPDEHRGLWIRSKQWHLSILMLRERGVTLQMDCFESLLI